MVQNDCYNLLYNNYLLNNIKHSAKPKNRGAGGAPRPVHLEKAKYFFQVIAWFVYSVVLGCSRTGGFASNNLKMSESKSQQTAAQLPADAAKTDPAPKHQESVADLVREHNRALHAFLLTRVRDEHEAREVAQEAYVRMLQLTQPGAVSFLRAYLFKTAANIALDRAKERSNRARLLRAEFTEDRVDELTPDRRLLSNEDVEIFKCALLELSPKCRRAFLLCRLEGHSDVQVAARLAIQPRMVRHYLAQAGVYCQLRIKGFSAAQAKAAAR